jgi:phosphoglycolate phosphatase
MPYPRAILFDLDGTLIDSVPDLAAAIDQMLEALHCVPAGEANVRCWVGNGAKKLVQRALHYAQNECAAILSAQQLISAYPLFIEYYAQFASHKTQVYAGVKETLTYFKNKGVLLAVVTNKPQQFTPEILERLGLADFFQLIVCGDTLPTQKPHPEPLLYVANAWGLSVDDCVMVGDSVNDIAAANAASMRSVCVSYGYNHGEDTQLLPATYHISTFAELITLPL